MHNDEELQQRLTRLAKDFSADKIDEVVKLFDEIIDLSKCPMSRRHQKHGWRTDPWIHTVVNRFPPGIVAMALDRCSSLEVGDGEDGSTILLSAIRNGDLETAKIIIARGASLDAKTRDGMDALHVAIQGGDPMIADFIWNLKEWDDLPTQGNLDMLESLGQFPEPIPVERGRIIAGDGWNTPFEYENDDAEPEYDIPGYGEQKRDRFFPDEGKTRFHFACESGNVEMIRFCSSKGIQRMIRDSYGNLPIHNLSKLSNLRDTSSFEEILELDECQESVGKGGFLPMHFAIKNGNLQAMNILLSKGAKLDARAREWDSFSTPVKIAEWGESLDKLNKNVAYLKAKTLIESQELSKKCQQAGEFRKKAHAAA